MKWVLFDLIYLGLFIQFRYVNASNQSKYLKKIGLKIREIRKSKGFSMEFLASEAEIEYRQLGRIERGEINTSVLSLLKLAEQLNVEITEFFKFSVE